MPVLISTPDITADTGLGAAGCASGSHTCSGKKPTFAPKPNNASVNKSPAAPPARHVAKSCEPSARPSKANSAIKNAAPRCVATR
ncbi:MAG: hypothetical protein BWX54_01191 [Verrucomicrobia bacterium ADurb.Bin018]|nr:MAG: hypothetical protein BWX54_01191 [Verrucomicrobia bacterium ADurb.Bin018]